MAAGVIEQMVEVAPGSPLAVALAARAGLLAASQANYQAVFTPADPGGLPPGLRLALGARMARLGGDERLAAHYEAAASYYEPDTDGSDPRRQAILRHVDLVTAEPRQASAADIAALQDAGVAPADIVRLSQVIAFLSYQLRLIAGLRLMGAAA